MATLEFPVDAAALESVSLKTVRDSTILMAEARGWIIDAFSLDADWNGSDSSVLKILASHYDGGLTEFYRNSYTLTLTEGN